MTDPFTVLGILVFVPAIVTLYFFLGEFERYFKANKALFMVLAGIGLGMIIGFFSLYFPLYNIIYALLIIALIEIIKFFIMLQKPFRLKYDAPFYSFAFGSGLAAMMIFTQIYGLGWFSLEAANVLFIFLLSYNYTFVNAGTAGIIGEGSRIGEFWRYLLRGFLLAALHGSMMTLAWTWIGQENFTGGFTLLFIGAVYGTYLVYYVYSNIFPEAIEEKLEEEKNNGTNTNES